MPEDNTFDYECAQCSFKSTGWATEELMKARATQHETEHKTNEPMPELVEFLSEVN